MFGHLFSGLQHCIANADFIKTTGLDALKHTVWAVLASFNFFLQNNIGFDLVLPESQTTGLAIWNWVDKQRNTFDSFLLALPEAMHRNRALLDYISQLEKVLFCV